MSVVETKAFLKFSWASLLLTADYSVNYEGASYYFASAENLETFKADPAKYIPQHGGFCSYGVSVGKKFDGDPDQFVVHDGQLFLFLNAKTRELFLEDITGVKATADTNWEAIERIAVTVNGRPTRTTATRIDALLAELGHAADRRGIAVALNGEVVPRAAWATTPIAEHDTIEIVGAVQGG